MTDMTEFETEYDQATRRVMQAVARRVAHNPLPIRLEDGTSPIVVALPTDTVEAIDARLARAGGSANIMVAFPDKIMLITALTAEYDNDIADVAPNSTVEMLIEWLQSTTTGTGSIRLREPRHSLPRVEELEYAF
jgi:hypothetical protein